ncbi:MAG: TetR/AcrR family transcriptional regulator [Patulibacter sp.]
MASPAEPPSPRRRRMSATQRREVILEAATEVFARHGFHQTAIDQVAQAAGVSKALIYEHFASKTELQQTVIRELVSDLFEDVAVAVAATPADVDSRARLRAGIDVYFRFIEQRAATWHMLFREGVGREASQTMLAVEPTFVNGIAAVLSEAPEAAPIIGTVEGKVRLRIAAQMITGSMHWLGNWWVDNMDLVDRETIVDWALDGAWLGLEGFGRKIADHAAPQHPAD